MKTILEVLAYGTDGVGPPVDISRYCESFTYTDNAKGEADDLQITLAAGPWVPQRATQLQTRIQMEDWPSPGQVSELRFGSVSVDDVSGKGLPGTVTVKATSTMHESPLAGEKKDWQEENTTLEEILYEKADDNEVLAVYESERVVTFTRVDQRDETDLAFLDRICADVGHAVKVQDKKLIIYQEKSLEARPPVANLDITDMKNNWGVHEQSSDVFGGCQIDWLDPETKQKHTYVFRDPEAEKTAKKLLKVTDKPVKSELEAEALAIHLLREKNQKEYQATIPLPGRPDLQAGLNVTLSGLGNFGFPAFDNRKFFIFRAVHSVTRTAGYSTDLSIRACLVY